MNFGAGAMASETASDTQGSVSVKSEAKELSRDYRIAPGDRLNILVYDQPQLSGEFIIDGGGGIFFRSPGPSASVV